jgi:uncharacterized protein (TIGR03437 family)
MKNRRLVHAIAATVPSALLLYAYSTGPEPRYTGAPGDDKLACSTSGCHASSVPLNGGGGNVKVNFPGGLTYTPGVAQTLNIVITDAQARLYGFQMTARLESNLTNGQAGDFTPGAQQIVICDNNDLKRPAGCPANIPVQFIEHSNPFRTNSISVQWTPPATNVGNVHIYVAANAANGDGNNTGDHIYTADYVLTPQTAGPPTISLVQSAGAFNPAAGLASGTWLEIYGSNLADTIREWAGSDFTGARAPTSLANVSVTVNGIPGYVDYVSSGQVNVQAPEDSATGSVDIQLTKNGVKSNSMTMQKKATAPALLAPASFNIDGRQWAVAQFSDQTFVGKPGLISGVSFRPAKPGETIVFYGVGWGPVTPATPAGTIAAGSTSLATPVTFRFGSTAVTPSYAGLAPNFVGLYQFNVVVPSIAPGDVALAVDAGGTPLSQNLFITIGQ